MLIGALLIFTWFVLLIRYPARAVAVSGAALSGLVLITAWVLWDEHREARQLAHLELRLHFTQDATRCPPDRPLALHLRNGNDTPLLDLRWKIAAYAPGDTLDLAQNLYETPRYRGPGELQPGASWQDCLPLPPLRPNYRASSLEFRAENLHGRFAD